MGRGGGEGGGKNPQVKTRGDQLPTDGPDHTTRPKGHHSGQGYNSRPITPNWCAPQVPMCRSWFYKASNTPLRKADHLSLAIGDMVCVQLLSVAISWIKKMNLNFCVNYAHFRKSGHK